ncbi:MAG: BON domain-containing protein [Flavobacteriales bacterium]|nr:BON domain-containing protein [Flavobacteriales bacterium]
MMNKNYSLYAGMLERLQRESIIDEPNINIVFEEDGFIRLRGEVKNVSKKYLVENVIREITSVRWIMNEIQIISDR